MMAQIAIRFFAVMGRGMRIDRLYASRGCRNLFHVMTAHAFALCDGLGAIHIVVALSAGYPLQLVNMGERELAGQAVISAPGMTGEAVSHDEPGSWRVILGKGTISCMAGSAIRRLGLWQPLRLLC
jgi:hypothetical protein